MDDSQQKARIDEDARKAKEQVDINTAKERQILADQEIEAVRCEADEKATQIQNDSQK